MLAALAALAALALTDGGAIATAVIGALVSASA